jgi:predicted glycosyltransferase
MSLRVFIWVQSRLGLGHFARALKLAAACSVHGMKAFVAHGGMPAPSIPVPQNVTLLQLPPAQAPDLDSPLIADEHGQPIDDAWRARRIAALHETIDLVSPDVIVTETFPLGRRIFAFEWLQFLDSLSRRTIRPLMISSIRDIVTPPEKESKALAMIAMANAHYDLIVCHGEREILPLEASFPATADLTCPLVYTGYLGASLETQNQSREGVIVAAGGGAVGRPLFDAALKAKELWRRETGPWTIVGGPQLDKATLQSLRAQASDGVTIHASLPGLAQHFETAQLVVAQAGYNTVVEALSAGARLTVVPYATPKETEQTIRADRLAQRALLTRVEPDKLSPERLTQAMEAALDLQQPSHPFPRDGAARAAAAIASAWSARR